MTNNPFAQDTQDSAGESSQSKDKVQPAVAAKTVKVIATQEGFHNNARVEPGKIFEIPASMFREKSAWLKKYVEPKK